MEETKSLKERLKEVNQQVKINRRGFLKGLGVVGGTAFLSGCGVEVKSLDKDKETVATALQPPEITEKVVPGAAPHNCGGRCVTKAYVKDGVIKRFVTDERPDKNLIDGTGDNPQRRACLRCRSNIQRFYRADRLQYPMKQTKERGDLTGFIRISWEQAFSEIAEKTVKIKETYGLKALYNHYASGDGASIGASMPRLLNLLGGAQTYRSDYSWPSIEHMSWFTLGQNLYFPQGNSKDDVLNAEVLMAWSNNYSETIWGTNSMWYMQQAREKGVEVISVESRISNTVATLADNYISIVPGTDAALLLAMMYVMIKEELLDVNFIKKYVHGFYDDPTPTIYHDDVDKNKYIVPAGSSLSAYVLGNDTYLVNKGVNLGISIYQEKIYYNVNADDELYGKATEIYGQVPKTPEWAEKITGVPADTIRKVARKWATKKTTTWIGGGFNRLSEGEQAVWLIYIMGAITKNFGRPGCNVAMNNDKRPMPFSGIPGGANPLQSELSEELYDISKLTASKYTPAITRATWPVFLWPDVAKNGGTGKSDWNDGQVKRTKVGIKALFNFAGNCLINQCGDANRAVEIVKNRNNIELIVVADNFLTSSARYADYLLPAATAFEKNAACTGWVAGGNVIYMGKAVEALGEAKPDYQITAGIAEKLGIKEEFTEGRTDEEWLKKLWDDQAETREKYGKPMSYEEWKEKGIYVSEDESTPSFIQFKGFLENPAANPLATPSGKFEAYSQSLVEDYEARGYNNLDRRVTLKGALHDGKKAGRFIYPVAMYIPALEGMHADGSHPDVTGAEKKGYTFLLNNFHKKERSHSTHNNNAYLNELFKMDKDGNPAYLDPDRAVGKVWDDDVYEALYINPDDAKKLGIKHGDRVLISNDRGKAYAAAHVTQRVRPGIPALGQGAWFNPNPEGIDIGGSMNTFTRQRPTRICQGMTLGADTRVMIEKA